jgi:hypothetical protein
MLKSLLGRSFASAAAAGAVLAASAIAGPAAVTATVSPVACQDNYPNPIATSTNLTLRDSIVEFGTRQRAFAKVSSTASRPTGSVVFSVAGKAWTVGLDNNGEASKTLPSGLSAERTYKVRARFVPNCITAQVGGSGDSQALTVFKANTRISSVLAPSIKRGEKASVRAVVGTKTRSPKGEAKVVIWKGGKKMSKVVDLRPIGAGDSVLKATFGKVRKPGTWNVKITFLGSDNFKKSVKFASFRVKR